MRSSLVWSRILNGRAGVVVYWHVDDVNAQIDKAVGVGATQLEAPNNTEVLACTDVTQWESWLADHHEQSSGIWLLIAKKGSDEVALTISDALDVALCYGWIDSQRKSYDANYYLQRYSHRRPKSPWSKLNVRRVVALTDVGRMRAPGLAEVAAAQADGRWAAAYKPQRNARLPPDFAAALEQNDRARTAFEQLDKTGQYAIILPVLKATTPASRAIRLRKAIAKLRHVSRRRAE